MTAASSVENEACVFVLRRNSHFRFSPMRKTHDHNDVATPDVAGMVALSNT